MTKMMAPLQILYKLTPGGVYRKGTELDEDGNPYQTFMHVPESLKNRHWKEYLDWLADGNTPEPYETQEETDARTTREEVASLKRQLTRAIVFQTRLIGELFRLIKLGTTITNEDIRPNLLDKYIQLKQIVDRLKEIDE